jgi:hypothetical protein
MQKRSENGNELSRSKGDPQNKEPTARDQALFVDGHLDVEAYFQFLDDYQRMFPNKTPRTPIQMKIVKL